MVLLFDSSFPKLVPMMLFEPLLNPFPNEFKLLLLEKEFEFEFEEPKFPPF